MSEEDSDSAFTDSQAEEEGELPVIQLCGLVEELRYQHSGSLRRPPAVVCGLLASTPSPAGPHPKTAEKELVVCLVSLAVCLLLS